MNDDERRTTEQITRRARETYNAPPPTPRDEMWSVIEARLDQAASRSDADDVLPLARRRGSAPAVPRSLPWWLGIAAALVIGLGIGRLGFDRGSSSGTDRETPAVAERPVPMTPIDATVDGDTTDLVEPRETGLEEPGPARERSLARAVEAAPERMDGGPVRNDRELPARDAAPAPTPAAADGLTGASLPYLVATRQHLGRSESFLTSVRAELDQGGADSQVGPWARSLLVRTRLLLGSPAATDAGTRRLLEDLELMLAQIAIAAEAEDSGETRMLDRGLEDGSLLYRLRSATDGNIGSNARGPRASSL